MGSGVADGERMSVRRKQREEPKSRLGELKGGVSKVKSVATTMLCGNFSSL